MRNVSYRDFLIIIFLLITKKGSSANYLKEEKISNASKSENTQGNKKSYSTIITTNSTVKTTLRSSGFLAP